MTAESRSKPERFSSDGPNGFDLNAPVLTTDFDAAIDDLVRRCPVSRHPDGRYVMLSRYRDVQASAEDWSRFSSAGPMGIRLNRAPGSQPLIPVELDPPEHTRWRAALFPWFTRDAVERYRPALAKVADDLLAPLAQAGEADMAKQFANVFPGRAFFDVVLGVPPTDIAYLSEIMHNANYGEPADQVGAWSALSDYTDRYLRRRQGEAARGDLVDAVLNLQFPNDPISWEERVSSISLLITGGLDTTAHVLGGAIFHLGQDIRLQEELRKDRAGLPLAVEEWLRYFATALAIPRTVTDDVTIGNQNIRAGERVLLGFGAACRDPELFVDPTVCDVKRRPNRHLAFGHGRHRCIGAHLAREEILIAVDRMLTRFKSFEVPEVDDADFGNGMLRSIRSLPVTLHTEVSSV